MLIIEFYFYTIWYTGFTFSNHKILPSRNFKVSKSVNFQYFSHKIFAAFFQIMNERRYHKTERRKNRSVCGANYHENITKANINYKYGSLCILRCVEKVRKTVLVYMYLVTANNNLRLYDIFGLLFFVVL